MPSSEPKENQESPSASMCQPKSEGLTLRFAEAELLGPDDADGFAGRVAMVVLLVLRAFKLRTNPAPAAAIPRSRRAFP